MRFKSMSHHGYVSYGSSLIHVFVCLRLVGVGCALSRHLISLMRDTSMPNGLSGVGYSVDDVPSLVAGLYSGSFMSWSMFHVICWACSSTNVADSRGEKSDRPGGAGPTCASLLLDIRVL